MGSAENKASNIVFNYLMLETALNGLSTLNVLRAVKSIALLPSNNGIYPIE